jgi:hypothetical protein
MNEEVAVGDENGFVCFAEFAIYRMHQLWTAKVRARTS